MSNCFLSFNTILFQIFPENIINLPQLKYKKERFLIKQIKSVQLKTQKLMNFPSSYSNSFSKFQLNIKFQQFQIRKSVTANKKVIIQLTCNNYNNLIIIIYQNLRYLISSIKIFSTIKIIKEPYEHICKIYLEYKFSYIELNQEAILQKFTQLYKHIKAKQKQHCERVVATRTTLINRMPIYFINLKNILILNSFKFYLEIKMFRINRGQQINDTEGPDIKELVQDLKSFKNLTPLTQKTSGNNMHNNDIDQLINHIKKKQNQMHLIKQSEEQLSPINLKGDQSSLTQKFMLEKSKLAKFIDRSTGVKVRKRKQWQQLKNVITNQRVKNLKNTFIQKLKRNNIYSAPIHNQFQDQTYTPNLFDCRGIQLQQWIERLLDLLVVINVIATLFTASLQLIFQQEELGPNIKYTEIVGMTIFLIQIISNLTIIKFSLGRKLQTFRQISKSYLEQNLYIDFLNFLIMFLQISTNSTYTKYLKLFTFCKIANFFKRIEKLEVYFIENYYKQQYWTLAKVFLFNFLYAHILSIALIAMSYVNQKNNWILAKGLQHSSWFQKYIWSYYWSTTIMLTIGFGDIVPACYQQAFVMIFLQTLSCIILAYNINCVGTLITNIRYQDMQKSKNLKIFKKLTDKNNITSQLCWKVNNFIEQHSNMKKMFSIQQQSSFVQKLPVAYKTQYLKEVNKTVFKSLFYFNNIMNKTLFDLAQKLQKKIAHPQEVLLSMENNFDLLILKNGEIGCQINKGDRVFSELITNKVKVLQNESCFMLHANFFTKAQLNYKIKSLVYSIFYSLPYEKLIQSLREFPYDYQFFCQLRDGSKYVIDQFETFKCQYCKTKHTQFTCPKLHFIPIRQHIIDKQFYRQKRIKNPRSIEFERDRYQKYSALNSYLQNQSKNLQTEQFMHNKKLEMICRIKEKYTVDYMMSNTTEILLSTNKELSQRQSSNQINSFDYAAEQIKSYVAKIIGLQNGQDQLWSVGLDQAKNYKGYFKKGNPDKIGERFRKNKKKKVTDVSNQSAFLTQYRSAQIPIKINRFNSNINAQTPFDIQGIQKNGKNTEQIICRSFK